MELIQQNDLSLIQIDFQSGVVSSKPEEATVRESTIKATPLKHLDILGPYARHGTYEVGSFIYK